MFLGITADVANLNEEETSCSLILHENPLTDFVDLPPSLSQLHYSNLICGVIRGALEQVRQKQEKEEDSHLEKDKKVKGEILLLLFLVITMSR